MKTAITCSNCPSRIRVGEEWPGDAGPLCFDCWEVGAAGTWWDMTAAIPSESNVSDEENHEQA